MGGRGNGGRGRKGGIGKKGWMGKKGDVGKKGGRGREEGGICGVRGNSYLEFREIVHACRFLYPEEAEVDEAFSSVG